VRLLLPRTLHERNVVGRFFASLQVARVVVMPVASAIVIGLMLSLARRAFHYRIPPTLSAIVAVVFFLLLIQFALQRFQSERHMQRVLIEGSERLRRCSVRC
jgi:hypothetical protein